MSTQDINDVIIIGGGVIGCSVAYHLRKAGVEKVLVLERAEVAAEASTAAAGLLSPLAAANRSRELAQLLMASWQLYPELIPALEKASGVNVEYVRPGSLHTANAAEIASLQQQMAYWQSLGVNVSWLSGEQAREREPLLSPDVAAAIYSPDEGSIRPSGMTRAFAGATRQLGVRILERIEVVGVQREGDRVTGVQTALGEIFACKHLVIAAGAWSARCGNWLGFTIPVRPTRGQILAVRQPEQPLKHILMNEDVYIAPKPDNTIFVGATVEDVGFDKSNTVGGVAWLLNSLLKHLPSLEQTAIADIWSGLRPGSPDRDPILGKAPGWENVTLATGHSGIGFETCAITGKTIAELITTGQTPELIRPFGIERFL